METIKDVQEDHGIQLSAMSGRIDTITRRLDTMTRRLDRIVSFVITVSNGGDDDGNSDEVADDVPCD